VMRRPPPGRMVRRPLSGGVMRRPTQLGRMMGGLLGMRRRRQHGGGEHSRQRERGQNGAEPTSVHIARSPSHHYLQCLVAPRGPAQVPLSHWLFRMHGAPEGWVPRLLALRQIPPSQLREAHCRLNRQCDPSAILAKLEVASSITRPPARTRRCIMSPSSSRRSFSFAVSTGLRSEPAHPLPCNSTEGNGASREGESPRNLDTSVIERSSDGVRVTEASSYPLYG